MGQPHTSPLMQGGGTGLQAKVQYLSQKSSSLSLSSRRLDGRVRPPGLSLSLSLALAVLRKIDQSKINNLPRFFRYLTGGQRMIKGGDGNTSPGSVDIVRQGNSCNSGPNFCKKPLPSVASHPAGPLHLRKGKAFLSDQALSCKDSGLWLTVNACSQVPIFPDLLFPAKMRGRHKVSVHGKTVSSSALGLVCAIFNSTCRLSALALKTA